MCFANFRHTAAHLCTALTYLIVCKGRFPLTWASFSMTHEKRHLSYVVVKTTLTVRINFMFCSKLSKFCDKDHPSTPVEERHNSRAETPHNVICKRQSAWEVMRRHDDFKTGRIIKKTSFALLLIGVCVFPVPSHYTFSNITYKHISKTSFNDSSKH